MMKPFVETDACKSGKFCNRCRADDPKFRNGWAARFEMPAGWPDCPFGVPMGATTEQARAVRVELPVLPPKHPKIKSESLPPDPGRPLTPLEQSILDLLAREGEVRQADLGEKLGEPSSINPAVTALRQLGLVKYCKGCGAKLTLA